MFKPSQASGNRAIIGYEGNPKDLKIVLKKGDEIIPNLVTKIPQKDSLQVWFNKIKVDSLNITINKDNFSKSYNFKIKDQKKDTLSFSADPNGAINFRENFSITASIPLVKIDNSKITLRNKDSIMVSFTTEYDTFNQKLQFNFKKEDNQKYTLQVLPDAFIDFFEQANDTLNYKLSTKSTSEYGNLILRLERVKQFPIIVQLTNEKGEILATEYTENSPIVNFEGLIPNKFYLRIIYDENKNKQWDPGNFLEKRQAEEVIYFPKEIDVRANWDVDQPFDLGN